MSNGDSTYAFGRARAGSTGGWACPPGRSFGDHASGDRPAESWVGERPEVAQAAVSHTVAELQVSAFDLFVAP